MMTKKFFIFLLTFSTILMLYLSYYRFYLAMSPRYLPVFLLLVILYIGFVILCLFSYIKVEELGLRFCLYLFFVYISAFLLADFIIGSKYYYSKEYTVDHPIYHHTLRPGEYKLAVSANLFLDYNYNLHVNSLGLRSNKESSLEKPKDCFRILVLGDSFTEGDGVNDNETFCYLLEEYLNDSKRSTVQYEVLNAGVDSYVPILEYLYLKTDGIKLNPDLVIIFLDMSDLTQTPEYLHDAVKDEKGNILGIPPPQIRRGFFYKIMHSIKERLYFSSMLFDAIRETAEKGSRKMDGLLNKPNDDLLKYTLFVDQKPWESEWKAIYEHIDLAYDYCDKRNINFAVVIYPWGYQVNDVEWAEGRRMFGIPNNYTAPPDLSYVFEKKIQSKHIPVLNLFPAFKNYKGKDLLYYKRDMHWTKYGHELTAKYLFDFVHNILQAKQ